MKFTYWASWIYKSEEILGFSIGTGTIECPPISTQDDVKNIARELAAKNPSWTYVAILGFGRLEGHDY